MNYTTEMDAIKLPTEELQPALSAGFSVKSETCIVIEAKDHLTNYRKGGKRKPYDRLHVVVASPTIPDGIRINDRRIVPLISTLPKHGDMLTL